MTPIVFSLLDPTKLLAREIAETINGTHQHLNENVADQIRAAFQQNRAVIGIMASGILMRAIAPAINSKHDDPAVIAISPDGQHVLPLLGGHHGANILAKKIAEKTGGTAAITTASENRFNISLEEPPVGYKLKNQQHFKPFMASVLSGNSIRLNTPINWLEQSDLPFSDTGQLQITITDKELEGNDRHLVYAPTSLAIGIGCERQTSRQEVQELVEQCLMDSGLSKHAIACITSIDLKADETAINAIADYFNVPVRFFSSHELNKQAARLQNPSDIVLAEVGCPGVAEGAALAIVGENGNLIVAKTKSARATCAVAQSPIPMNDLPGRARGKLSVIGIGPGSLEWRSPESVSELNAANDWVGYGLYLNLVADLHNKQEQHRFDLGKEEDRVRHAFKLAGQGRKVALICSGDAAIYAMAALVYEVLDSDTLRIGEQRVEINVLPGISAFQAASARAGALIGHDFCTISLSDLLTPWETIEKRLHAAAQGDFNVAFYNPRSLKRTDQLKKAIDILRAHRREDTPVIIASNLGRPTENVTVTSLNDFDLETVDMLTIVLVGSSQSKRIVRGDGQHHCYTPRGYANKTTKNEKVVSS